MARRDAHEVKRSSLQHRPKPGDPITEHTRRQAEIRQRIIETQGPGRDEAHLPESESDEA